MIPMYAELFLVWPRTHRMNFDIAIICFLDFKLEVIDKFAQGFHDPDTDQGTDQYEYIENFVV